MASTSGAAIGSSRRSRAAPPARTRSPGSSGRERTVAEQPLLVVWEVLGHLDLLLDAGRVTEQVTDDGCAYGLASFALAAAPARRPRPTFKASAFATLVTTNPQEVAAMHEPADTLTRRR